jgi:ArsR family transcriptional regulator
MSSPDLFRALADATRLRILNLLLVQKEICVCELCELLGEIQPKISRHLATLRRADLVQVRREGKWKYYSLAGGASPLQRALLRSVRSCVEERDVFEEDRERLRALEPGLRCG